MLGDSEIRQIGGAMADRNSHKDLRIEIINEWANNGLKSKRTLFENEKTYRERIEEYSGPIFHLVPVPKWGDPTYQKQIAHLIDAMDLVSTRPDLSFDVLWRACEAGLELAYPNTPNADKKLGEATKLISSEAVNELWRMAPRTAFNYLAKRILMPETDEEGRVRRGVYSWDNDRLNGRMNGATRQEWKNFQSLFQNKYGSRSDANIYEAARALQRMYGGESIEMGGVILSLPDDISSKLLYVGLIYQLRNDRAHASSMPIHLGSRSDLKYYSLPFFGAIACYTLLMHLISAQMRIDEAPKKLEMIYVYAAQTRNIRDAQRIFQGGWR